MSLAACELLDEECEAKVVDIWEKARVFGKHA